MIDKLMPHRMTLFRCLIALFFCVVGIEHFRSPELFVDIVPPFLPEPLTLVYVSGFFEFLGGVGLLLPQTRRAAGWGLLALLVAVYPANIHMLVNEIYLEGMPQERWILWARMPFQLLFALGVVIASGVWLPKRWRPSNEPSNDQG
jgi:uncharacterized membrane protein